ncbi:tetratricopeptide repeat protein [Marivita hallyeonensis]|uniref:Tetratricopeptide repeat protein 38 n=1 Tax=Marivita hallyeonensis TaxID=996342 RepID=A0A1M5XCR7_9RHOB|nr:tetratricopeptide repeat protein [Marivita hallyeonensis]SHH97645.1 hypothetical protein SAMN05443551_3858 [Marivita hallyeonensis]
MLHDICSCEVSLTDERALSDWNAVVLGILSHGQNAATHLGRLLDRAPDFAIAHALKGLASLMLGRRELVAVAADANRTARAKLQLGGATERERLWCAALDAWLGGHPSKAIAHMEASLRLNPADTISMKLSHGIRFMLGDNHGMRASVEAVMPAHGADHPLRGYALGCLAFGLEETGEYAEAERLGLLGLELAGDDAWGLHAVTHVYDMTHQVGRGITLIDENTSAWDHCNNFRYHVWWHKALLHLEKGDVETVLTLYDTQVRSEKTDDYRDISNATSLLMRLELDGVDVGDRWEELATLSEMRSKDGLLVFADLHYMLALAGDHRADALTRMTARIARDAQRSDEGAKVMDRPGVSAAKGLSAFGAGQYDLAFKHLQNAQPHFQSMGGSHAQRDVFERLTIEAGLRAGQLDQTDALLIARTSIRDGNEDSFAQSRRTLIADTRALLTSLAAE